MKPSKYGAPESPTGEVLEEMQLTLAETQALYHVAHTLIGFKELPELLQMVVDTVAGSLPANRVTLITFDLESQLVTHFVKGGPGVTDVVAVPVEELWDGLAGWVIREMKPALSPKDVPDPRESLRVRQRREESNCGAIIVVPLRYQNMILGTMTAINCPEERDFTQRDVELMVALASHCAVAIENARLYQELQSTNTDLEKRVAERTAELADANARLQAEIIEHKRAAQALQTSEARYRLLVETMNDGLAVVNENIEITYVNRRFCDLLGYTSDELLGRPMASFLDPVNEKIIEEHIARRRKGEQSLYEIAWSSKNGRKIFTLVSGTPLFSQRGEFMGSFAVVTDITERKKAEEERLAHLRFFESMNQINRAIQGTNDLEQMMSDVLDALLIIFGCDRAWLVYPCDPEAATWQVSMERARPEYPGVLPIGVELPLDPVGAEVYRILRNSQSPVQFHALAAHQVPIEIAEGFAVQSFIAMAFYPKVGLPWAFGVHQCAYMRVWSVQEERLFQEIGRRLEDSLTSLLTYRALQDREKALAIRERESRTVLENVPDFIVRYNTKLQRIYVNPAWEKASGMSSDEVIFLPPKDLPLIDEYRAKLQNVLKTGQAEACEFSWVNAHGEFLMLDYIIVPEYDPNGELVSILSVGHDITERKQTEARMRALIDAIPDMLVRHDREGRYLEIKAAPSIPLNYAIPDAIGKTVWEMLPHDPQLAGAIVRRIERALDTQEMDVHEYKLFVDGTTIYREARTTPSDENEVLMLIRDITERKQAEATLQRYNQRLAILRDIDRRILAAPSPEAIAAVVLEHVVQLIPCEWLSIVLYNEDISEERVFAWQHTPDIHIQVGESQPVVPNQILERLKSGQSVITADLSSQAGPRAQLAEDLVAQGVHAAMANPLIVQGRLIGVLALASVQVGFFTLEHQQIAEEIGAQVAIALHQAELNNQIAQHNVELEQRVRERTSRLESANRELELFSYSVSHDLRTPLRAIQGFAEIIARRHRVSLNEEGRRYFDHIVTASEQMNQLIIDLLDYARLGRHRIRFEVISLSAILPEIVDNLLPQITETDAQIHLADGMPDVVGDKSLLKRIFANLLQNALVYHQSGIPPAVNINYVLEFEHVIIRVTDKGIGIPAEFHEKIFNIFQRLHGPDQYPGTGIGLAIVRRSVELLNGTVWVESETEGGSTFCIKLPCPQSEEKHL